VHALLRLGAQQVADARLEVVDGLLAVALGPHVVVDVAEPVGPTFQLDLKYCDPKHVASLSLVLD